MSEDHLKSENSKLLTIAYNKQAINVSEAMIKTRKYLDDLNKNLNGLAIDEEIIEQIKVLKNQKDILEKMSAELIWDKKLYLDFSSSFTNIKISNIIIGDKVIKVSSYPDCIAKYCKYLIDKDNNRFEQCVINNSLLGNYFAKSDEKFKSSVEIVNNLYLNTNMNSNTLIRLLERINDAYGLEEEIKFSPAEIKSL